MYLLDANTFMEAARHYYHFEMAPAFWEWLVCDRNRTELGSVPGVKDEILRGAGDLVDWAAAAPLDFWRPVTEATLSCAAELAEWATHADRRYRQVAVDDFLSKADMWIIAEAMACGGVVVTREEAAPDSKKVIKIPDACAAFGVECAQPFVVYKALGLRLS